MIINNNEFLLKEIPVFNPDLDKWEYKAFWKEQISTCLDGKWVSGKWMPGPLYQYVNFQQIPLEDKDGSQKLGKPYLRDIDWEYYYIYEEARGFSGFSNDSKYTCNRWVGPDAHKLNDYKQALLNFGLLNEADLTKTYIPAREYLRKLHSGEMGYPMYANSAKNVITGQGRGGGKTIGASGFVLNNWIFGGATNSKQYFENLKNKTYNQSLTIMAAWDKKWISQLHKYVLDGHKFYPGAVKSFGGTFYPSPLSLSYSGSKEIGDQDGLITAHGSRLISRVFADNPLSTNSGRPNLLVIDEAFFAKYLGDFMGAAKGSEASKLKENLVMWMMGTGGIAKGSSVAYAEEIFFNPEEYNCLSFEDPWEGRKKIGYFVPITKTNMLYKDPNNNFETNLDLAEKDQLSKREALKRDRKGLENYIVNNPLMPSEVFLITENSVFPTALLKTQLMSLETDKKFRMDQSYKGWLKFNDKGDLYFEDIQDAKPIRKYPFSGTDDEKKGCIEIWKKPVTLEDGSIPRNRYIAGADVVDKAASTTDSLPSIIVYDRLMQEIVCEYTGRTNQPSFFFEQCRRIAEYYNATIMYEQNLTGMFTYFEQSRCLYRLADTPKALRNQETFIEGQNTSKGINKSGTRIEETGVGFILDWLALPLGDATEKTKVDTIYSPALIKEMLKYQPPSSGEKVNVDRISALIMLFWFDNTLQQIKKENFEGKQVNTFLNSDYFVKRGLIKNME